MCDKPRICGNARGGWGVIFSRKIENVEVLLMYDL